MGQQYLVMSVGSSHQPESSAVPFSPDGSDLWGGWRCEKGKEVLAPGNEDKEHCWSVLHLTYDACMLQVALTDVQTNPSIANILPDLVQYLQETVSCQ